MSSEKSFGSTGPIQDRRTIAMAREDGDTMDRLGHNRRSHPGEATPAKTSNTPPNRIFWWITAIAVMSDFDQMSRRRTVSLWPRMGSRALVPGAGRDGVQIDART